MFRTTIKMWLSVMLGLVLSSVLLSGAAAAASGPIQRVTPTRGDLTAGETLASPMGKSCSRRLYGVEKPGPVWEEHRHWLEATGPYGGNPNYTIIDMTTYRSYKWVFWGNDKWTNHAKFGVSSWWALTNPGWKDHYWLLVYPC